MEPFRAIVANGKRQIPDFRAPKVRQIAVPTTLSAGEFNARAGITDTRLKLKQSFVHRAIVPESVVLDPAVTVHTPEWFWLSSGVRAIDHAVETLLDGNDYTDGTAPQMRCAQLGGPAGRGGQQFDARLRCMMGLALHGRIVSGTRLGASHAIGHILGGSANVPHGWATRMLPRALEFNAGQLGTPARSVRARPAGKTRI
jgi:maleylacetate reductase